MRRPKIEVWARGPRKSNGFSVEPPKPYDFNNAIPYAKHINFNVRKPISMVMVITPPTLVASSVGSSKYFVFFIGTQLILPPVRGLRNLKLLVRDS